MEDDTKGNEHDKELVIPKNQGGHDGVGRLTVERRDWDGSMVASELYSSYPMKLLIPSQPNNNADKEKVALSCFVVGYGGGCVSGDSYELNIHVKDHASCLVTSQSTTKVFKTPSSTTTNNNYDSASISSVITNARIGTNGLLVLVPQPMQCFAESQIHQFTNIELSNNNNDSSLLFVDWYTGGRCFGDEESLWELSSYWNTTTIASSNGDVIVRDALRLSSSQEDTTALQQHVRHYPIITTVFLIGPRVEHIANSLLQHYSHRTDYHNQNKSNIKEEQSNYIISCGTVPTTSPHQKGVIFRMAATSLELTALCLSKHIGTMDGQLESDPFLEILASKQSILSSSIPMTPKKKKQKHNPTLSLSLDLIQHSYGANLPKSTNGDHKSLLSLNGASMMMMNMDESRHLLTLFQLIDSCAPTGGFAHSNTLETAYQLGWISTSTELQHYIWNVLLQTVTSQLPYVNAICQFIISSSEDSNLVEEFCKVDAHLTSTMTSHVARRASMVQGSGMFRVFPSTFPEQLRPTIISKLKKCILSTKNPMVCGHAATCWGCICGMLRISPETCMYMYLYTVTRDMINAAIRMNIIGPMEGSYLTNQLCQKLPTLLQHPLNLSLDSVHQVAPLIDILSNAHDRLYTRLFNS